MVNQQELIDFLRRCDVTEWNHWRAKNSNILIDLQGADLKNLSLSPITVCFLNNENVRYGANFRDVVLRNADLSFSQLGYADFRKADLRGTRFYHTQLFKADFRASDMRKAKFERTDAYQVDFSEAIATEGWFFDANLTEAKFIHCNLRKACFIRADLMEVMFEDADLQLAKFSGAWLNQTKFFKADLRGAVLISAQAGEADFGGAQLTGANIENWNIGHATRLDSADCDFIYRGTERCPSSGNFKPGEFATLFQQAVDTIDLIFKDGIDWQAFFQSFQDLRSQYADQELSIQAIERKRGGAFVVRLEVSQEADKPAVESSAKQLYEKQLKALEAQYEKQLRLQGEQHLEEIQRLIAAERQEKATLMGVMTTMANNQGPKNDFRGAQFGGGFIETNRGTQYGGVINNYGSSAEDITRLLSTLRDQAQAFPAEHKDQALDVITDLERDIQEPEPDAGRIGRRLKQLGAIAVAVGGVTSGVATFSGDLKTFTSNVIELTEKLGIPIEQVQPNQIPPATP